MADIHIPASEVEIAESIRWASEKDCVTIRKLAFERDKLLGLLKDQQKNALHAVESIIDGWEDWDAEAWQAAQQDQDDRSWRFVMRSHLATCLWRAFEWPMNDK